MSVAAPSLDPMAYDEALAARLRDEIGPEPGLSEKKMFGGLAFLVNGNMAVAASGQGGLMVRCDPAQTEALLAEGVDTFEMRGKAMSGWLRVSDEDVEQDEVLARWVGVGVDYARTLPPK